MRSGWRLIGAYASGVTLALTLIFVAIEIHGWLRHQLPYWALVPWSPRGGFSLAGIGLLAGLIAGPCLVALMFPQMLKLWRVEHQTDRSRQDRRSGRRSDSP